MTPVFRTEPEAAAELEAAALWYEARRTGLGVEFIEAFDSVLARVGRWPEIGHRVPGLPSDVPARRHPFARISVPRCLLGLARCNPSSGGRACSAQTWLLVLPNLNLVSPTAGSAAAALIITRAAVGCTAC